MTGDSGSQGPRPEGHQFHRERSEQGSGGLAICTRRGDRHLRDRLDDDGLKSGELANLEVPTGLV